MLIQYLHKLWIIFQC